MKIRIGIARAAVLSVVGFLVTTSAEARFLQTDPVGYSADLNLYTYVANDPTNKTDPTGREPEWAWRQTAEDEAYRNCPDWACVDARMRAFDAQEQQRMQLQAKALAIMAAPALGAAGIESLVARTGLSAAFEEAALGAGTLVS